MLKPINKLNIFKELLWFIEFRMSIKRIFLGRNISFTMHFTDIKRSGGSKTKAEKNICPLVLRFSGRKGSLGGLFLI